MCTVNVLLHSEQRFVLGILWYVPEPLGVENNAPCNYHVFVLNHPSFPRSPSNSILKMKYSFLKPNLISEMPELQSLSFHGIHKIQ